MDQPRETSLPQFADSIDTYPGHTARASRAIASNVRDRPGKTQQREKQNERERLLDQERAAHEELVEVDHRKDEFLAMLGHELRNPLSDIVSAVQILEQLNCRDSVAREMQAVIARQSRQMTKLIDDLLDISRISCGKIILNMGRVDLTALTRNAIADHQHHFDQAKLTLVVDLPKEPVWVRGDATRLSQVMTNLLHNAAKFTDPGGTIGVGVTRSEDSAAFSVRDTGIGIAPTELSEMFEPFRQAESSRVRSKGGLGLGLALSQRLVEKHGGAITATSGGLGYGSLFSIRLPLDQTQVLEPAQPALEAAATPSSRRILIVDDRRDARLTLTVLLKRLGQQVTQAEDGAAAIDAAGVFHPDIVLCDIGLPDIDGYAVAQAIRANPLLDGVYLVALTGYGRAEDRACALAAGFDQHLTKPVSYNQLMDLLRSREPQSLGLFNEEGAHRIDGPIIPARPTTPGEPPAGFQRHVL